MEFDKSFILKKGETLILKKTKGYLTVEFTKRKEKHLEDIVELEYKNPRSKKKEPTSWITEKDLISRISYEINCQGFKFHKLEKVKKESK
jgi:hypothetical protein